MTTKTFQVGLDLIEDNQVFRNQQDVQLIAESMRLRDQMTLIHLRHRENEKFEILDGLVRYRAAVKLNWEHINAVVYYNLTPQEAAQLRRQNAMSKVGRK